MNSHAGGEIMRDEYDIMNLNPRKNPYAKANRKQYTNDYKCSACENAGTVCLLISERQVREHIHKLAVAFEQCV